MNKGDHVYDAAGDPEHAGKGVVLEVRKVECHVAWETGVTDDISTNRLGDWSFVLQRNRPLSAPYPFPYKVGESFGKKGGTDIITLRNLVWDPYSERYAVEVEGLSPKLEARWVWVTSSFSVFCTVESVAGVLLSL